MKNSKYFPLYIFKFRNRMKNIGLISFMAMCPALKDLDLSGNPVCQVADYRNEVKSAIPQLKILDDMAFYDKPCGAEVSSPEVSSSWTISSTEGRDSLTSGNSLENMPHDAKRPFSASGIVRLNNAVVEDIRPVSAGKHVSFYNIYDAHQ